MSGNRSLILAGVKGAGTGSTLARFAPTGTTLPASAIAALDGAFADAGWCSEEGLKKAVSESTTSIRGFGSRIPLRKLVTESETTFELTFLESNTTAIEVYNRKALGSISVDVDGAFDFTEGEASEQEYCGVFDMVDGANRIRGVAPLLSVTDRKEFVIAGTDAVKYSPVLTAYPGSDGVAIHWYYLVPILGS